MTISGIATRPERNSQGLWFSVSCGVSVTACTAGPAQDQLAALPHGDELLVPGVDGGREDERAGVVEVPRGLAGDDVAVPSRLPRSPAAA
jgi:hypothetical protein